MAKEFKITSLRLADLEKELNYLKTTREREVAAMIAEARSYGDLSENSEYDAAKNEQAKLYGRIAEIENTLRSAVFVDDSRVSTDAVSVGTVVRVLDMEFDEEDTYTLVGFTEADPAKLFISGESPIGKALIGAHVGDVVEAQTPGGALKLKVLEITRR